MCVSLSSIAAYGCICSCIFSFFLGNLCPSLPSWLHFVTACEICHSLNGDKPCENRFLTITDHTVAACTVAQFHGSFHWEEKKKNWPLPQGGCILVYLSSSLNANWENVRSYQLLLGCRGQTAKCHQIANQLIQISLHWAKSLLIPLKIQSVFPHRSACSSLCLCVLTCRHKGQRER